MNIRLTAIGLIDKPRLRGRGAQVSGDGPHRSRVVYFSETERLSDCPIYDRYRLALRRRHPGPAVVEELDSTTLIQPGYRATVATLDNLVLVPMPETADIVSSAAASPQQHRPPPRRRGAGKIVLLERDAIAAAQPPLERAGPSALSPPLARGMHSHSLRVSALPESSSTIPASGPGRSA